MIKTIVLVAILATFASLASSYRYGQPYQWEGNYKLAKNNKVSCSSYLCFCCPDGKQLIRIDRNSASRNPNSYVIRGKSSGVFCKHPLLGQIDFDDPNSNHATLSIFESKFRVFVENDIVIFEGITSDRCGFALEKTNDETPLYDLVINIDSLIDLETKGWDVWFKNLTDYQKKKNQDTITIGVAGLYNKGKTWLLNKLTGNNFKAGFHVHTVGLSMKYADLDTKVASFLDTAGFETPIEFFSKPTRNTKAYFEENVSQEQNNSEISESDVIEQHKLKIKDRHVMEDLIQNFMFEKANIIVIVVGHMTFSDQKLINKVLSTYGETSKDIFILHNYFEMQEINHVLNMIERDIKSSFDVRVSSLEISSQLQESGQLYHQEIYKNMHFNNVRHLVTAKDDTPAGKYFNPSVFSFLQALIQSKTPTENFDLVEIMREYTEKVFPKYIDIKDEAFQIQAIDEGKSIRIKCKTSSPLTLKPVSFDVNGALLKSSNQYTPPYNLILKEDKLVLTVDLPGLKKNIDGKRKINYKWERGERSCLEFEAELVKQEEQGPNDMMIAQNRARGKVKIHPPCLESHIDVESVHDEANYEDGVLTISFKIKKEVRKSVTVDL